MHGAGTGLGEAQLAGEYQQQNQQDHHKAGQHQTLALADRIGPPQGKALPQKDDAHQNTGHKAHQTGHGGQITAAQADDHAQRAAQKDQRADHDEHAQNEAAGGGGTGFGPEFLGADGRQQGAQNDADDLRADVLDLVGAVQSQRAGNVPLKAGDAEAHVPGVAGGGQHQSRDTDHDAGQQDQTVLAEPVVFSHPNTPITIF